ncbi:MAG TPA: divalent-cation tolerance protein CutA [Pyrinomonadaceae bacterium]|nr:divalent-cation tolerance protein CutA [Pyrinomonadaceae bacterium]
MTTVPSEDEAEKIAGILVAERLAACVQILPKMTSVYVWKGETQREAEHLLLIKTAEEKYAEVEHAISANHSYDVPEIVAIQASHVSDSYLAWITEQVA